MKQNLEKQFVAALVADQSARDGLAAIVSKALKAGHEEKELVAWGVKGGFSEQHVRNVLSRIRLANGERRRASNAGQKTPPEALALAEVALTQFGDAKKALRMLESAARAIRAELKK